VDGVTTTTLSINDHLTTISNQLLFLSLMTGLFLLAICLILLLKSSLPGKIRADR
jgi:hypothetical protein